jgi:hypothetical protein
MAFHPSGEKADIMRTITEPARQLPIISQSDVVVAGGGPGGIVAALAAARAGAKTLLIERYGFLGGMATAGLMTSFNGFRNEVPPNHVQTVRGIAQEIVDRLLSAGGACACTAHGNFGELKPGQCPYAVSFDPEVLKRIALEMLGKAGVRIMLHTLFCRTLGEGRSIDALAVESKSGRATVKGSIYIDATGDGDVAFSAGAGFEKAVTNEERLMAATLMYRLAGIPRPAENERRLWINGMTTSWGPGVAEVDASDVGSLTRAEIQARAALPGHIDEWRKSFPQATLVETATIIGIRESRRIKGLYTITEEDCLSGRPHQDSIAVSSNPVPAYYGERRFLNHLGFEIPYRSLVPADLDNLILAGRCISACQPAFQSARSMAPLMAISQAAGAAAALCVAGKRSPMALDPAALQERLVRDGAVVRIPKA